LLQSDGQTDIKKVTAALGKLSTELKSIKHDHFNLTGFTIRICNFIFVGPIILYATQ